MLLAEASEPSSNTLEAFSYGNQAISYTDERVCVKLTEFSNDSWNGQKRTRPVITLTGRLQQLPHHPLPAKQESSKSVY